MEYRYTDISHIPAVEHVRKQPSQFQMALETVLRPELKAVPVPAIATASTRDNTRVCQQKASTISSLCLKDFFSLKYYEFK